MWIVSGLEKLTGMMAFSTILRTTAAVSAALLLVAGVAHSTGTRQVDRPAMPQTAAEETFQDAPFGVDPMVTGPTTASFKALQEQSGCGQAEWPNIPLACYPKR